MIQNELKKNLLSGKTQIGCWLSLGNSAVAETCACANFDWLLIDTEHSPTELSEVHHQLQVLEAYPVSPIVRAYWNDTVFIKRLLDLGVQSLLIPYVQSAEEAKRAVMACQYPPKGVRGVSGFSRANFYGRTQDYFKYADDSICLMVQVESRAAVAAIPEIAAVDGVDVVFIGPADLAADMGYLGQPRHPEVKKLISNAIKEIKGAGKIPATLAFVEEDAKEWLEHGAQLVAVTSDMYMVTNAANNIAAKYKEKNRS